MEQAMAPEAVTEPTTSLTPSERERLEYLEQRIERGIKTFIEVWNDLLEIRDGKLYRADYRTFEEYCERRWELKQSHAYRLMDAARVVENLKSSPIGELLPANEAQARPLTQLKDAAE